VSFTRSSFDGNGGTGLSVMEFGAGVLTTILRQSSVRNNATFGIDALQSAPGTGVLTLVQTLLSGNTSGNVQLSGVVQN
jgi:hypothetical protein